MQGIFSQLDKSLLVKKLRKAREQKRKETGKCEGRKGYIDLNPLRAGLVERPEDYRWNSLGYHLQTENKDQLRLFLAGIYDLFSSHNG